MATTFQPPPTWALPILVDEKTGKAEFNPVWLKWFVDLTAVINAGGGSSIGTVTKVSVTTANGVSGTVANPTSTPAISLSLGAITPSSIAVAGGTMYLATPAGASQSASSLWAGTGAPNNANGSNGDYYFRSDGGVTTHIYYKSGGSWAGII